MKFAIVELKYMEKKFFIVRDDYMKKSTQKDCLCYISTNLTEAPNFQAKYCEKWEGVPGMFKVFITKITNSLEAAITFLKNKRLQTVPKKFRGPTNTDSELAIEENKRKRTDKRMQKTHEESAHLKNTSHLANLLKSQPNSSLAVEYKKLVNELLENTDSIATEANEEYGKSPQNINKNATKEISHQVHSSSDSTVSKKDQLVVPKGNSLIVGEVNKKPNPAIFINSNDKGKKILLLGEAKKVLNQAIVVHPKGKVKKSLLDIDIKKKQNQDKVHLPLTPSSATKKEQRQAVPRSEQTDQSSLSDNNFSAAKSVAQVILNHSAASISSKVPESAKVASRLSTGNGKRMANDNENLSNTDANHMSKKRKVLPTSSKIVNTAEFISPNKQSEVLKKIKNQELIIEKLQLENSSLKVDKENLTERNVALQKALVACTKSSPSPLLFEKKDGGRLYSCGIFLESGQCNILDAIGDDRKYCNALILAVFGSDVLKVSSVKGTKSNRTKAAAKTALDPTGLKFIFAMMATRTNFSEEFYPYEINKIINKKIANLLAASGEPKPRKKRSKKVKEDSLLAEEEKEEGERNEESGDETKEDENYDENIDDENYDGENYDENIDDENYDRNHEEIDGEKNHENYNENGEKSDEEEDRAEENNELDDNEDVDKEEVCEKASDLLIYQQQSNEDTNETYNEISPENSYYILDLPVLPDLSDLYDFDL